MFTAGAAVHHGRGAGARAAYAYLAYLAVPLNNYPTLSKDVNAFLSDNPSIITDIRLFVHTYVSHYVCILYVTYHFPPYVRHTKLMSYKLIFRNSIELFSW